MRAGNVHVIGSRRRWNVYVWMVILAMVFGFGILLGVMGLHSIKHKRTLNLLIQEKDAQLLSLDLLLQKEREHTQEIKAKTEGMRIKMYNLRARNSELKSKISDLHSTISSLRDDRSTIELHLKEKQKEAEIEDLKHHLQLCANVSKKNEPSSVLANETANENVPGIERPIDRRQEDEASKTDKEKNEYDNDKTIDEEGNNASFTGIKEFATIGNADSGQISNSSQEIDSRELETFGGKSSYVKRAKGTRWKRAIEKRGKRYENGSNLKSQQFRTYDHKQLQENNGEEAENSLPPVAKLENSTKPVDTEYTSVEVAVTNDVEHINSRGRIKVSETSENSETKTENDELAF